ncbi:uncharacterized protein [Battus philenor]|uniref:uncharacterized protein n=1 Tax=Battus philenor TaxID=42288 RepID=UPI0035CFEF16
MRCAKLQLQERTKMKPKTESSPGKPRRYCQKLLVDPQYGDDTKWTNSIKGYQCESYNCDTIGVIPSNACVRTSHHESDVVFLTVQTLQFKGELQRSKRPRTSFKYKTFTDCQRHRMFVKQVVDENSSHYDGDQESELTSYFFNDYAKYFISYERSRPSSTCEFFNIDNNCRQNKSVQVDIGCVGNKRRDKKNYVENCLKEDEKKIKNGVVYNDMKVDEEKITFHKNGGRKSITISKMENPETVQVIRVDVVCNYRCSSSLSNNEENSVQTNCSQSHSKNTKKDDLYIKGMHNGNKYLLTKSIKALDEKVSSRTNVTLVCKTFTLADRSKTSIVKRSKTIRKTEN